MLVLIIYKLCNNSRFERQVMRGRHMHGLRRQIHLRVLHHNYASSRHSNNLVESDCDNTVFTKKYEYQSIHNTDAHYITEIT